MTMMIEQPDIRPFLTRSGWSYRLNSPYFYEWEKSGLRRRLRIAAGFEYDGASVPRFLWTLTGIERDGLQRAAALVHDVMYHHEGRLPAGMQEIWSDGHLEWEPLPEVRWARAEADALFCRMLREAGVGMLKRRMMYRGVRAFGWMFWRRDRKAARA
jgi:hypothetical protein